MNLWEGGSARSREDDYNYCRIMQESLDIVYISWNQKSWQGNSLPIILRSSSQNRFSNKHQTNFA